MKTHSFFFLATWLMLGLCLNVSAQPATRLEFNAAGKFKILQFSDLHLSKGSPDIAKTEATVRAILETEKPDMVILTGDVVWKTSADPWQLVIQCMESAKVPFAFVRGNHDTEPIALDSLFDMLSRSSLFVGEKGPHAVSGTGNYILPIYDMSSTDTVMLFYFLDSHDHRYSPDIQGREWDWIHHDQIDWYRSQSEKFTLANGNRPIPALLFLHIPFPEFNRLPGKKGTVGTSGEKKAHIPDINSGLFASLFEMGDVMGVFVGHDHDNDFIGIERGIALSYCRVTGAEAYGRLERGARVIELSKNNPRSFDTWIRTSSLHIEHPYHYPPESRLE
jgi:UDP-2,3-diacylglucosamine pyrophosphatase LpxH